MSRYQQCLLLRVCEDDPTEGEQKGSSTSSANGSSYPTATPTFSFAILLPQVYWEEHPAVLRLFQSENVNIVDETTVARLLVDGDTIEGFEIFMDDSSSAPDDPLDVIAPNRVLESLCRMFGDNIRMRQSIRDLDIVKPVLDDSTAEVIKRLSGLRPEMHTSFFDGYWGTLLHLAAVRCQVELARLLVQAGADVNSSKGFQGGTPLHFAALYSSGSEMIQFLMKNGADINARDSCKYPPLQWATGLPNIHNRRGRGTDPIPTIKTLLDYYRAPLVTSELYTNLFEPVFLSTDLEARLCFEYLLERCFVQAHSLQTDPIFGFFFELYKDRDLHALQFNKTFHIFWNHLQKVTTLQKHLNPNTDCKLLDRFKDVPGFSDLPISEFAEECEAEVAEMKNRKLGDTEISLLELMGKKEEEVALLLRNKSVDDIAKSHELVAQFPIYGNILDYHLAKGVFRKSIQTDLMKCCSLFSELFRNLPDVLQAKTLTYFSLQDVLMLKRAADCPGIFN